MPKSRKILTLVILVLLTAPPAFSQNWPAFLLYQKNGAASGDQLGISVASAGDVNGDGKADLIVGAHLASPGGLSNAGSAYVYSGADGSLLYQKNGAAAGVRLGFSVASAGEMNGDGKADFIIGAHEASPGGLGSAGSAYVYSGADGSLLYQKNGAAAGDRLGVSVASAGEVNGDGKADFIVGAYQADPGGLSGAGSAYLYSGATGGLLFQKNGAFNNNQLGFSVAGAGDVNGDGRADFIIGAPQAFVGGFGQVGSAYVYSGADGSLLYQKNGAAQPDFLGYSVAGDGDVNGDGRADFIVGAHGADPGGLSFAGSAYVYSGFDGSLLVQKNGAAAGDQLGISVAVAGDVDGDGRADFILGANGANPGALTDAGSAYVYHSGYSEDILSISDISGDQGKQVRLQWKSLPGNDNFVQQFAIYRRVDGVLAAGGWNDPFNLANTPPGTWDFVTSIPALGDTLYSVIVPTLKDSTTSEGMHWSVFFVSALGENPTVHFDSPIDSGYSLDNLSPPAPNALAAAGTCQGSVNLSYSKSQAEDFDYFRIYRDTFPSFPTPTLAGNTIDSFFTDTSAPVGKTLYYRVRAVDFSGNEGNPSPQASGLAGLKGDLNIDASLTSSDVVLLLNAVFIGSPFAAPFCAADLNCDLLLTSSDVVLELNAVFLGTPVTCTP